MSKASNEVYMKNPQRIWNFWMKQVTNCVLNFVQINWYIPHEETGHKLWPEFVQINWNFAHEETGHALWPDFAQINWNFAHEETGHALWPGFPKLIN